MFNVFKNHQYHKIVIKWNFEDILTRKKFKPYTSVVKEDRYAIKILVIWENEVGL